MQDKAIALHDVDLSLGRGAARVHILKGISPRYRRGRGGRASSGPSGSGKSTLLMTMAGLERPDSGRIVVEGTDLAALDEDALARFRGRRIGIVFQSFHLVPTMTALENVALAPRARRRAARPSSAPRRNCRRWASATGCTIIRRSFPAASSSAWRSPAPSCRIRPSWWRTSRPAISTRPPASRSSTCSSPSSAIAARPWCS